MQQNKKQPEYFKKGEAGLGEVLKKLVTKIATYEHLKQMHTQPLLIFIIFKNGALITW